LYPQLVNDNGDSIDEGDHGNKTAAAQEEFFFVTATLEFWKIDRLVARLGDGCLVVAPKTIHGQANLRNKGTYNNKTMPKSSHKFSSPKLLQILAQKPIKETKSFANFLLLKKKILPNFVVEFPLLNVRSNWVLQD
jgi:hypothetical protein